MTDFEHSFNKRANKKWFACALLDYYLFIYAPRMVTMLSVSLFMLFLGITQFSADLSQMALMIACIGFACMIFEFPVFLFRVFKVVTPTGTFDKDSYLHFYPKKFLCRCGENESVTEYSTISGYFRFRNRIFLLMGGQMFFAVFREVLFEGKMNDFISSLEASGVRKVNFFSLKRWGVTFGLIILCTMGLVCTL